MSHREFKAIRCCGPILALTFFLLGRIIIPYPGLQNDEVLFAGADFGFPGSSIFQLGLFHRHIPVMHMSYLGSLKTWLYAPILALAPANVWSVRLPVLAIGAMTVWLFAVLLEAVHGERAAWIGGALLATDTMFLITTCFDWGPVALQHLLTVSGVLLVVRFARHARPDALFWGFLCFGLAAWDKALFFWIFGGMIVATIAVFPRELLGALTRDNLKRAIGGFALGALPLIAYNAMRGLATFRANSSFSFDDFARKASALRGAWNGSGLLGYIAANPDQGGQALPAHNSIERLSYALHGAFGDVATNQLPAALCLAVLLLPLLWRTPVRRLLLFCVVTFAVGWLQMVGTRGAGGSAHHIVLLWPVPHLFIAVTLAEASLRLRKTGIIVVSAIVLFLAGANLLLTNQYFYQLARYGSPHAWTDAVFPLSSEVQQLHPAEIVIDDWGILDSLVLLRRGDLPATFADSSFLAAGSSSATHDWDVGRLERALWIGHTPAYQELSGLNDQIVRNAASAGFEKKLIDVIADRHARPVFEVFRFERKN